MKYRALTVTLALPVTLAAQDTTATKASLLAVEHSVRAHATSLAASLSRDVSVLLPDLDILRGRIAVAPHLAAIAAGQWQSSHAVVSRDGTFGCTTGVVRPPTPEAPRQLAGRYVACWARDHTGRWQLTAFALAAAPAELRALPDTIANAPGSSGVRGPAAIDAVRAMRDADSAFGRFSADSGGPAEAFARWIAPDGMLLGTRAVPIRGPEQARQSFTAFPASGRFEWAPARTMGRAADDGSLGFTIGRARIARSPSDVSYLKYLTVWRREIDGRYRFVFDIGSDRPPFTAK